MQEKSNEQRKEQKRGYNLLDKEEEKSMLSCFVEQLNDPLIFILFAAAAIWGHVHYTCSSAFKCHSRSDPGGEGKAGIRGIGKNDKSACTAP